MVESRQDGLTVYVPLRPPARVAELGGYVFRELSRLAQVILARPPVVIPLTRAAPAKPVEGQVVRADGEHWDPGDPDDCFYCVEALPIAWMVAKSCVSGLITYQVGFALMGQLKKLASGEPYILALCDAFEEGSADLAANSEQVLADLEDEVGEKAPKPALAKFLETHILELAINKEESDGEDHDDHRTVE